MHDSHSKTSDNVTEKIIAETIALQYSEERKQLNDEFGEAGIWALTAFHLLLEGFFEWWVRPFATLKADVKFCLGVDWAMNNHLGIIIPDAL